jgi:hypothetical protein
MSYDISISLLKKNLCKTSLVKALGKGELIFKRRARGQSNMTTLLINFGQSHMTTFHLRQYPPGTPNQACATAVPSEYFIWHFLHYSEIHFCKQNWHWVRQQPVQPSMTEDLAIRIDYTLQRLYTLPTPSEYSSCGHHSCIASYATTSTRSEPSIHPR